MSADVVNNSLILSDTALANSNTATGLFDWGGVMGRNSSMISPLSVWAAGVKKGRLDPNTAVIC